MSYRYISVIKFGLFSFSLMSLLAIAYIDTGSRQVLHQPVIAVQTVPDACSFTDKTFCPAEYMFKRLITANDFSDVLEQQVATPVTCTPNTTAVYCHGITSGLSIQLFKITDGQTVELLTRNQYIGFFNLLIKQSGPLYFRKDVPTGDGTVSMQFSNAAGSTTYSLLLQKQNDGWSLIAPTVGTTHVP